jgi:hypothetical protein
VVNHLGSSYTITRREPVNIMIIKGCETRVAQAQCRDTKNGAREESLNESHQARTSEYGLLSVLQTLSDLRSIVDTYVEFLYRRSSRVDRSRQGQCM